MSPASACSDFDLLLSLHATNALRGDDRARLEAHLARCPECREQLEDTVELLQLTKLPAATPAERRVFASLPERTFEALRQGERRRGVVRRIALAMSAVAALSLVPLVLRDAPPSVDESGSWFHRFTRSGGERGVAGGSPGALTAPDPSDAPDEQRDVLAAAPDRPLALEGAVHERAQLASASAQVPVQAASWEEPDPDRLWEDSSALQALGELEETFAAEAAMQ